MLAWDPPANGENIVTAYHYRCRKEEQGVYAPNQSPHTHVHTVSGHVTSVQLTKNHGIVPLAMCTFEVRAVSGNVEGNWKLERAFIGMPRILIYHV